MHRWMINWARLLANIEKHNLKQFDKLPITIEVLTKINLLEIRNPYYRG